MHRSIATIDSPEFVNVTPLDVNKMMSKCEIKVLYIGENRNHSYITKEVASEMAKTLRGAPIVGYYKENKEDFADHGEQMVLDDEGFHFNCLTKPYGFVAPDAKIWFQKFEDTDDFGNTITREYLMTTGYLWTGQYEECQTVVENGKGQSMELDESTMEGHWATNNATGMDFFIIDDAMFSKLCILGDDVEPCFEGASVTKPQVSTSFSKVDDTFKQTLYNMMQELKFALEGGQSHMDLENKDAVVEEENKTDLEQAAETEVVETSDASEVEESAPESSEETAEDVENSTEETPAASETFANKDEDDKEDKEDSENDEEDSEDDEEDKDKKYSKLEEDYAELEAKYSKLEEDYKGLVEFKKQVEDKEKDELIKSFYMLSDEDKKEVVENKSKYTLEEIEAKLSVICVRNKVNFDLDDSSKNEETTEGKDDVVTTFSLNEGSSVPAWISALKNTQKSRKN